MPFPESADLKETPRKREPLTAIPLDRTPPHDTAAEQGVLGCILLDPTENLPSCIEKFREAFFFYDMGIFLFYTICLLEALPMWLLLYFTSLPGDILGPKRGTPVPGPSFTSPLRLVILGPKRGTLSWRISKILLG